VRRFDECAPARKQLLEDKTWARNSANTEINPNKRPRHLAVTAITMRVKLKEQVDVYA
jgi:hypothetical protein